VSEDSELASFAEFSIWRQGAVTPPPSDEPAGELEAMASESDEDLPEQNPVETAPREVRAESFIERYAHMFADDASQPEQSLPVMSPPRTAAEDSVQKPRNMGIVRRETEPTPAGDDEESIEQYMAKLLQRVRGDGPRIAASQGLASASDSTSSNESSTTDASETPVEPKPIPMWPVTSVPTAMDDDHVTTSLGTVRRKIPLAEQSADLEAFRALANESARRAISTHAMRKHRRNAVTKVIVSTLAGMTSLWLMLEAPHWRGLQFITALVSLMVAAYWAGQTYRTLIETLRDAAYDGPDDGLKDLVEALRPQLPIDVEK
jgi:hypothetical protein